MGYSNNTETITINSTDNTGKEETKTVSVIIPTLNAGRELPVLLTCLHEQDLQPSEIIVIDSASDDGTAGLCKADPAVRFIEIKREDYDHGGTRDLAARQSTGEVIVFLTQDALPADSSFLRKLTEPVMRREAAIATGRQLPKREATRMEALVRGFNYPSESFIRSKEDIGRMGIKAFFCSNVCSAYDREIYLELGGFEHPLKTNEDMFFAAKVLNSGYKIAYAAEATVYHSHNFTLRQQFKRNYIQGYEIARHHELLRDVPLESEGKRLAFHVSKDLLRHGHIGSFLHFGADCVARLAGNRFGRNAYRKLHTQRITQNKSEGNPSVCVLMSAYNGERYLQQQLDSLYGQKDVAVRIVVRDDGSDDSTLAMLTENEAAHECLSWYSDGHLGSARSFLNLIENSPESDYYALCDQDDVWDEDKLKCAVSMLAESVGSGPALYYSNLRVVDEELNCHRNAHSKPWIMKNKYSALADVAATGCTMVFNRELRDILKSHMPEDCKMHDEWIFLVCSFFGSVVYDFEPHISYRQHRDNVLGTHLDGYTFKWLRNKLSRPMNKGWKPRSVNAKSLRFAFGNELSAVDLKKVSEMADYRDSVLGRIRLAADPAIHGKNIKRDLSYRIKVIIGKA